MPLPRLALAVIGDEVGPSLSEMISFCGENGLSRLDMRTVDGRNLLGMTLKEIEATEAVLRAKGDHLGKRRTDFVADHGQGKGGQGHGRNPTMPPPPWLSLDDEGAGHVLVAVAAEHVA